MIHPSLRALAALLRQAFPPPGRHRRVAAAPDLPGDATPVPVSRPTRASLRPLPRPRSPYARDTGPLVTGLPPGRPFAPAQWWHDEDGSGHTDEGHAQRRRRRELWLATIGIDAGPSRIHGVLVGGAQ
ncbi:hypothetical protein QNO07_05395 [Streptomyces sp. 549]|uniref:hypothetical protein n=1 Tax=Streptomyces sp. 549 TaxID=3049076 RepID=UPI0024C21405|nr:hypothetical protein [Streptomyces sp. 549]MDK1472870.1 hypothetical protein [Streptomyces sp. 549]